MIVFSPSTILAYAGIQALIHIGARGQKDRQWGLSVFNSLLMSAYGVIYFLHWLFHHDLSATLATDRAVYQLQSYLVIDFIYNGFINTEVQQSMLEFWIHHSVYAAVCSVVIQYSISGVAVAYMILEVPTALRALGTIQPEWRTDLGFGIAFFFMRVLAPFVFYLRDHATYPTFAHGVFVAMQTLHCYWFYRWCKSQAPRLLIAALGIEERS